MIHVNVDVLGAGHDLVDGDGRLRVRVGLALYCDACRSHLDLPIDASPTSVTFGDLATAVAAHDAGCSR